METFLSIDVGGTTTKAVLFDMQGRVVASADRRGRIEQPESGWVERDMREVWDSTVEAVRACLADGPHTTIRAVSLSGHSDGLYPVAENGSPASRAIQATDTRAAGIAGAFRRSEAGRHAAEITGTFPFAGSPVSLCLWLRANEPPRLEEPRWLLFAKDWIRYRLTDVIGTDATDAAASFLDIRTGAYSEEALDLYGLADLRQKLPPIWPSASVVGEVTSEASAASSIPAGTPVVAGCHDVDAAAIGLGGAQKGDLSVVAGTFSINQVLVDSIHVDERWQVRNFVEPGRWLAMSTSPTSASNFEWFANVFGGGGTKAYSSIAEEVAGVLKEPSEISFLPYVFGAPDLSAFGSFMGIRSHHNRGHLARAIFEGVTMGHRLHLEWLAEAYHLPERVLVTGGASRNSVWMQMFADCLNRDVQAGDGFETPRGAAGLALVAVSEGGSVEDAATAIRQPTRTFQPRSSAVDQFDFLYNRFLAHRRIAHELDP